MIKKNIVIFLLFLPLFVFPSEKKSEHSTFELDEKKLVQQTDFLNLIVRSKIEVLNGNDSSLFVTPRTNNTQANNLEISFRFLTPGFGVIKNKSGIVLGKTFQPVARGTQEFLINTNRLGSSGLLIQLRNKVTGQSTRKVVSVRSRQINFKLNGNEEIFLRVGDTFIDPGFVAIDANLGDVSDRVEVDFSNLNINTAGRYTITYKLVLPRATTFLNRIVDVSEDNIPVDRIELISDFVTIDQGDFFPLDFSIFPKNASVSDLVANVISRGGDVGVSIADNGVTNNPTLFIDAFSEGIVEIEIRSKTTNANAIVSVEIFPQRVPPTSISIAPESLEITTEEEKSLGVRIQPFNAVFTTRTWQSLDPNIATVSSSGRVRGVNVGNTKIAVTIQEFPNIRDTINVAVSQRILPTSISLDPQSIVLGTNTRSFQSVTATILPVNTSNQNLNWISSNTAVATVDNIGQIRAVSVGNASVTATSEDDSSIRSSVNVTVEILPTDIRFNDGPFSLNIGETRNLRQSVVIEPVNTTNKKITWVSLNTAIATINSNGILTARGKGTVDIAGVLDADTNRRFRTKVTVIDPIVKVTSVTIAPITREQFLLPTGSTLRLSATVSPNNATNKGILWRSLDTKIANINSNGLITPNRNGLVKFEAFSQADNTIKDELEIRAYTFPPQLADNGDYSSRPGENISIWLDGTSIVRGGRGIGTLPGKGKAIIEISRDRFRNIVKRDEFDYTSDIKRILTYKLPSNGFISIRVTIIPDAGNDIDEVTISVNDASNSIKKNLVSRRGETVSFP